MDRHSRLEAERTALFDARRSESVWHDIFGIAGLIALAVATMWSYLPVAVLVPWAAIALSQALARWATIFLLMSDRRLNLCLWWRSVGLSISWGALAVMSVNHLDDPAVAWFLVFILAIALAGDAIYLPQTSTAAVVVANVCLALPFGIVLAYAQQWMPLAGAVGALAYVTLGAGGIVELVKALIQRRVDTSIIAEDAHRFAHTDDMTGLANRSGAASAIARLVADPKVEVVHCLFLDLDDFKMINDAYGYGAGDRALKDLALNLQRLTPDGWTACRFGGDEFVLLGANYDPREVGKAVLDLTVAPLTEPTGRSITSLKLSVGVASLPVESATPEQLFLHAGSALQMAKQSGKHQMVHSDQYLQTKLAHERMLMADLDRAMEANEIVAFAQPIVDVTSGRPVGVELLARWLRGGEVLPPSVFIPLVEQAGYSHRLDRIMINHAVGAIEKMAERGLDDLTVSVNVAASHLEVDTFSDFVAGAIARHDAAANRLTLEITESVQLAESKLVQATTRRLRSAGVGLSIDDFGTGYSSITQLLSLPFTQLKLDRSLVSRIVEPAAYDMIKALVTFATTYGLKVVAEGIESHTELGAVRKAGLTYGQGYFYGKPKPLDETLYSIARLLPNRAGLIEH